jgi:hypothetical protein
MMKVPTRHSLKPVTRLLGRIRFASPKL